MTNNDGHERRAGGDLAGTSEQGRRYRIRGTMRMTREVEVETDRDDYSGQLEALTREAEKLAPGAHASVSVSSRVALNGRAIARVYWYDLHGPGDVIIVTAAVGHAATAERLDGVADRLGTMGLVVVDRWNVGSCGSMGYGASLKVEGRRADRPFSPAEEAFLCGDEMIDASRRDAEARDE